MQRVTNESLNTANVRTVEEEVYKAIKRRTICAGRTDKDVSALSQVQLQKKNIIPLRSRSKALF